MVPGNRFFQRVVVPVLACVYSGVSPADEVIVGDLVVQGSLCTGSECSDTETFEFDTVRVKGPDPRLEFIDTSNTGSFPTNDWSLGVANTGANAAPQLVFRDDSNDAVVLTLQAATPGEDDTGGVALGAGSVLVPGAISVGRLFGERRVAYVADGEVDSDAATYRQLLAVVDSLTGDAAAQLASDRAAIDAEIADLEAELAGIAARLSALEDALEN